MSAKDVSGGAQASAANAKKVEDDDAGEKAVEQWKIKKLIKTLEAARGCARAGRR